MDPRPTPRFARLRRRALRACSAALIASVLVAGIAWAWDASTVNTATVTALSLGTPGSATATRTSGAGSLCTGISVTWNAVPNATGYLVERNVTGSWTPVATNNVSTTFADSGSWTNYDIDYRISAKLGNWFSPTPAIASIACGIGDVEDLAATFSPGCMTTSLSWTPPLGTFTTYTLERSVNGTWLAVTGGTGITGTSFNDTNQYSPAHATIQYRIVAVNVAVPGNYSNVVTATSDYGCLVPPTNVSIAGCVIASKTLTWTAAPSPATEYTISRKVGAAAFANAATNISGTTWTDTASHAAGTLLEYGLYSENGTLVDTVLSATSSLNSGFYVKSIAFGNAGTLGTLNQNDTVTVTFSQPVSAGFVTGTYVNTVATGGTRGVYIGATPTGVNAATSDIAFLATGASHFGTGNASGTVSWNANRTVWTWTANAGVPATAHAANLAVTTYNVGTSGTRAKCGGTNNLLAAPIPTYSGRW